LIIVNSFTNSTAFIFDLLMDFCFVNNLIK
jgi:hypothetical protein